MTQETMNDKWRTMFGVTHFFLGKVRGIARKKNGDSASVTDQSAVGGGGVRLGQRRAGEETGEGEREVRASKVYASL